MDRPESMAARRAASRAPRSVVLAAALAGFLAASPAAAQVGAAASPELASQKAMMLKGFFASNRLVQAREANPDAVAPLEADARAKLEAGEQALADGKVARAIELFDEGMRAVSRAVALAAADRGSDKDDVAKLYKERRGSAGSYLSVLELADDLSADERERVESLRDRLQGADRQFAAGNLGEATETLDEAYSAIVELVSAIRRGRTLTVSRVFETPKQEYEYEVARHQSYVLLVEIALAERAAAQPGLELLAARLDAESEDLRVKAERQSEGGDYVTAIETMESATERLLVILRATGAIVME